MNTYKILIGSPVRQKPKILERFLDSLKAQKQSLISFEYVFVDDNTDASSSALLKAFEADCPSVYIIEGTKDEGYTCDDETHNWNDSLMLKVAGYKNKIIEYAIKNNFDYLFLIDSDLVIHPNLIEHLISVDKPVVSEVFWCRWYTGAKKLPNVWLFDEYDFYPKGSSAVIDKKKDSMLNEKFLNMLRCPGLYEVGGLGACTLIKREALLKGVNFSPIKNLTIHGEDRFFCIRAAVLDISLYVDTHYPAYHIYRHEDLAGVDSYIEKSKSDNAYKRRYKAHKNRLTLSMVVKNEENRYLEALLKSLQGRIDEAVIIDDGSTDRTIQICQNILQDIPVHIIRNKKSIFRNETELRQWQWDKTIKTNPDWILNLDADEFIEESFWQEKQSYLDYHSFDVYAFRLYDMWNETHYREDKFWNAHMSYRPFLIRYQPDFPYCFHNSPQHCGRFPENILSQPLLNLEYRIKHYGWATERDRIEKKQRYEKLDPGAIYGDKGQYDSIMDEAPVLVEFLYEE